MRYFLFMLALVVATPAMAAWVVKQTADGDYQIVDHDGSTVGMTIDVNGDIDYDNDLTLDDDDGASPSLTFTDESDETAVLSKEDSGELLVTTLAADGLEVVTGNLRIGNGSPGTASMDGEDAYIEGQLEVDGASEFDGTVNVDGAVTATSTADFSGSLTGPDEIVTSANTLGTSECGKISFIDSATGFASTLPAATQGCSFDFIIQTDSTGTNHTVVTTGSETIKGFAMNNAGSAGNSTAAADTITFVSGSTNPGDRLNVWSDGTSWHAIGFSSASGGITFSSAI